jgi:DNA (cytosine-5)-methyltransferase 1
VTKSTAGSGKSDASFEFIDLFAGIGGFHIALSELGGECVFASEWNPHARQTYEANFRPSHPDLFDSGRFAGDLTQITQAESREASRKQILKAIPKFEVLAGGFPCQPFSHAGYKKGFEDERGNLFFDIRNIIDARQPKAVFLENVSHLLKHDNMETFRTIKHIMEYDLGYSFFHKVVKASDYGLPQLRPRLFMIGFRDSRIKEFDFPEPVPLRLTMSEVFEQPCAREVGFTLRVGGRSSGIDNRHNWDAYRMENGEVRTLTSREGKRMMGFPDKFKFPVSEVQALKQLGNSVAVDAVRIVAGQMLRTAKLID